MYMPQAPLPATGLIVKLCSLANGRVKMYELPAPMTAPAATSHQSCFFP